MTQNVLKIIYSICSKNSLLKVLSITPSPVLDCENPEKKAKKKRQKKNRLVSQDPRKLFYGGGRREGG